MKKIYSLLFLMGFLCPDMSAQTVIIGAGAQNGTSSNSATGDPGPIYKSSATSSFIYSRYHYLYTTSELSTAGLPPGSLITGVAWYMDNGAASNSNFQMEIWLENSALTAVQTPPQTWAALTATATQVYNSTTTNFAPLTGWRQFNTSAPFVYTGGALEISVASDMSQGSSPWTTAGFSWTKDPINDRTISYCGSSSNTTLSNARTVRPQLRITYIPGTPCSGTPTAGTVTAPTGQICPLSPFSVSLSGTTLASGINIQWQSRPGTSGPWTDIPGATNAGETFSTSVNTQYRAYVVCTNSSLADTSLPATVNVAPLFPAGTYTINAGAPASATNFQSFTDAVNAISCGIAGPIVFNVVTGSGPYNEQVIIPEILTTSATNTVTFNCNGETLTYSSSNTNERAGVKLDGADHITFNNLVVTPTGTYGFGFHLLNDADSNTINGCTINNTLTSTSSNYAGIAVSGSATGATTTGSDCDGTTITNNTVNGGYYGITMMGGPTPTQVTDNKITDNTVLNIYAYGIYVYGNDGVLVADNDVSRPTRTSVTTFYGITFSAGSTNGLVTRNRIHDPMGGTSTSTSSNYGIYFTGCDATVNNENVVSNNVISFESGNGTQYGLYNAGSDYVQYYHNTISLENASSTGGTTRGFYQTTAATGIDFKNNIISITRAGTGTKHAIYINNASTVVTANYNNYYINAPGTNYIGYFTGPGSQTTLAAWQTATSNDANTLTINPGFTAPAAGNYLPTSGTLDDMGTPVGVVFDFLGNTRSTTTPDIGAYKFTGTPLSFNDLAATAERKNDDVLVSWSILNDENTEKYYVERSSDAKTFVAAGTVNRQEENNSYTYTDVNATTHATGNMLYYRLQLVNKDGSTTYSPLMPVKMELSKTDIKVYPNPFADEINVLIQESIDSQAQITLRDIMGKIVAQHKHHSDGNAASIRLDNLNNLPKGIYELEIVTNTTRKVFKVIK